MAINIKSKPEGETSAHDKAAEAIETEIMTTKTKGGEVLDQTHESHSEPQLIQHAQYERIDLGMSFKMPVADYTMLEFSIRRSVPFPAGEGLEDQVFDEAKAWVEAKLNSMIEEQQAE